MDWILPAITIVLIFVGLIGSVVPGLPGVPLIFAAAAIYAYLTGFEVVGIPVIVLLAVFAALAFAMDFIATAYGARRFGATSWGMTLGAIGGLVGTFAGALFLGIGALFGLLLGTIGGVFLGEYLRSRRAASRGADQTGSDETPGEPHDWGRTLRAGSGVLVGYLFSAVAQGTLGLLSVIVFVIALFVE